MEYYCVALSNSKGETVMTEIISREEYPDYIHYAVDKIDPTFEEDIEEEAIETEKGIIVDAVNESEEGDQNA